MKTVQTYVLSDELDEVVRKAAAYRGESPSCVVQAVIEEAISSREIGWLKFCADKYDEQNQGDEDAQ